MSLEYRPAELRVDAGLADAVTELVMTVHEDRPLGSEVAAIDHLPRSSRSCRRRSSRPETSCRPRSREPACLDRFSSPASTRRVAAAQARYWRDLRPIDR